MGDDLRWNTEAINDPKFAWVAYLVCPKCGSTWRGLLPNERPGAFGPVEEECPDCELGLDGYESLDEDNA